MENTSISMYSIKTAVYNVQTWYRNGRPDVTISDGLNVYVHRIRCKLHVVELFIHLMSKE